MRIKYFCIRQVKRRQCKFVYDNITIKVLNATLIKGSEFSDLTYSKPGKNKCRLSIQTNLYGKE